MRTLTPCPYRVPPIDIPPGRCHTGLALSRISGPVPSPVSPYGSVLQRYSTGSAGACGGGEVGGAGVGEGREGAGVGEAGAGRGGRGVGRTGS
ncbi:hypothetical protein, partial [Streptomyces sp. NEAU-H3]|uniref:hypothetical protein n=1 Tax=Streptomyces sp. NEAU-H3 TaxID=2720636 RepID=UPI0035B647C4